MEHEIYELGTYFIVLANADPVFHTVSTFLMVLLTASTSVVNPVLAADLLKKISYINEM